MPQILMSHETRRHHWLLLVVVFHLMWGGSVSWAELTIGQELYRLDQMRAGNKTPFAVVETEAARLLKEYPNPDEHARIYFTVAEVHAQSGMLYPDKIVEFSKKALEGRLDPYRRLQLYIYWGDAIKVSHRGVVGKELAAARSKAARVYLQGLKDSLAFGLRPFHDVGKGRSPVWQPDPNLTPDENYAARDRDNAARLRDALGGQVTSLYSLFPFAADELNDLATEIVGDPALTKTLVDIVKARVDRRIYNEFGGKELTELAPQLEQTALVEVGPESATIGASSWQGEVAAIPSQIPSVATQPVTRGQISVNSVITVLAAIIALVTGLFLAWKIHKKTQRR